MARIEFGKRVLLACHKRTVCCYFGSKADRTGGEQPPARPDQRTIGQSNRRRQCSRASVNTFATVMVFPRLAQLCLCIGCARIASCLARWSELQQVRFDDALGKARVLANCSELRRTFSKRFAAQFCLCTLTGAAGFGRRTSRNAASQIGAKPLNWSEVS